jgi:hypothetical protein
MTFSKVEHFVNHLSEPSAVNATIAAAATSSPLWLNYLRDVSELAALLLPVLGVVWLSVQMYAFLKRHTK